MYDLLLERNFPEKKKQYLETVLFASPVCYFISYILCLYKKTWNNLVSSSKFGCFQNKKKFLINIVQTNEQWLEYSG